MTIEKEKIKALLLKMSHPLHYSYVSRYILNCEDSFCLEVLNKLVDDNILMKHKSDGYYVINSIKK